MFDVIAGTLPDTWADTGAFPALLSLSIWNTPLNGTLPLSWARAAALPQLISLELGGCNVGGTLPAEWATPAAFQRLSYLHLTNCGITGKGLQVVTFNNFEHMTMSASSCFQKAVVEAMCVRQTEQQYIA